MPAAIPALVVAASTIAGSAASAWAAGQTFALTSAVLAKAAFSAALSLASSALSGKPKNPQTMPALSSQARDRKVTIRNSVADRKVIYGEVKASGTLNYVNSTGSKNKYMHLVMVLAGHELSEIGDVYFNSDLSTHSRFKGKYRIRKHLGKKNQIADPDLISEIDELDESFKGQGCAYIYVRLEHDTDAWPNGLPNISAVVKGKKVFDPREPQFEIVKSNENNDGVFETAVNHNLSEGDSVWIYNHAGLDQTVKKEHLVDTVPSATTFTLYSPAGEDVDASDNQYSIALTGEGAGGYVSKMIFSDNPSLCTLDFKMQPYGFNCEYDEMDIPYWISAANICDEEVEIEQEPVTGEIQSANFTVSASYKQVWVPDPVDHTQGGGEGGSDNGTTGSTAGGGASHDAGNMGPDFA